jgi:hypothetical protein
VLPRIPRLRTSLRLRGGMWFRRVSYGSGLRLFAEGGSGAATRPWHSVGRWNKERLSYSRRAARLASYQGTPVCYGGAYEMCGQTASS